MRKTEEREKSCPPYGDKAIILNEERKKFGLAPISGGDVAIIRVSDSSKELNPNENQILEQLQR